MDHPPAPAPSPAPSPALAPDKRHLIERVREAVIGGDHALDGPFGRRPLVYADYTASGRALGFIEDYLRDQVLPYYANTHTEASATGLISTHLREQARALVKRAINAGPDDAVIFVGAGMTGAVNRLIAMLGLAIPRELDDRHGLSAHIPASERPVVFIGPYEHHSNELPWRETVADVVAIGEDREGRVDLRDLARQLAAHAGRPLKIGSFSAASNVTGIRSDTGAITALLHDHEALSFWDFAGAGPYVELDMNPEGAPMDALFLSPHKFVGGPGTPGVLAVKKALLRNAVPSQPGGGTVAYVNETEHRYLDDPEMREEGGTPAIVEAIRCGLVFQLKSAVGAAAIEAIDDGFKRRALESWRANPNIEVLGNADIPRLAIISFIVRHQGRALHHEFVVALLNDLFGIQSRGGCSCAGPYGHRLLHIDARRSKAFEKVIAEGAEGLKPGWTRVGFNYFFCDTMVDYIIAAVNLIADQGWKLLPWYAFDTHTGLWRHVEGAPMATPDLGAVTYDGGGMRYAPAGARLPDPDYGAYLDAARRIFDEARRRAPQAQAPAATMASDCENLRWFPTPEEGLAELRAGNLAEDAP
ncbi:MAG: aminotransferase class V-fold PLP-dependent enzyme [Hyphomicrobiales bacterium]|nr:aminotransferase class V-fold PLP-dependent enzyme [Hyphomicrobiales bacterium]